MDNSYSAGITLPVISGNSLAGQVLILVQNPLSFEFINIASITVTGEKTEQTNNTNDPRPTDDPKTNSIQHLPGSNPALADEEHISVHDNGEEETTMQINFSMLLRIIITVLFFVMII